MATLAEKIRAARESVINVRSHKLTIRRPTAADIIDRPGSDKDTRDHLQYWCQFVVGWDMQWIDLVPGGAPDPAPFEADGFYEWVSDLNDEEWGLLINAIRDAFVNHKKRAEEESKNS